MATRERSTEHYFDRDDVTGLPVKRPYHVVHTKGTVHKFFTEGAAEFFMRMENRDAWDNGVLRNFNFPGDRTVTA